MNLKALRCCVEIVRQGSFTKAAQHLHIAQPALSMAVTRLEEELGVTLFNRTTRKVILTAEGEQFLPRIASALREMDVARQELRDMADLKRGEVRLGIPPMFGLHYVPGLMNAFRQLYPGIAMTVFEGSAEDIGHRLEQREIDLALLESRRVPPDKESILLGSDEMLACMHPDHPYAGKAFLTAQDLRNTDMVVFDRTFVQRHLLDAFSPSMASLTRWRCRATSSRWWCRPRWTTWAWRPCCARSSSARRASSGCRSGPRSR